MKKKIVFVVLSILLCCGCTTKYTIEIDENLGVKETAVAIEGSDFFQNYPNTSVETVVGMILSPNLDYLNEAGFEITNIQRDDEAGVSMTNSYSSISEYIEKSKLYEQYGNLEYTESDGQITLKINGLLSNSDQDQSGKYVIDSSEITIKLPHTVTDHNADKVNKKNGEYTWIIEEPGVMKELYITFDKKVRKQIPTHIIVVGILFVMVLGGAYWIWSKLSHSKKERNEF